MEILIKHLNLGKYFHSNFLTGSPVIEILISAAGCRCIFQNLLLEQEGVMQWCYTYMALGMFRSGLYC